MSLTQVLAKIFLDGHSDDQYITMQRLQFHIPTATESHGWTAHSK